MKLISGMIVIHVVGHVVGIFSTLHLADLIPRRTGQESVYLYYGTNNARPTQSERVH